MNINLPLLSRHFIGLTDEMFETPKYPPYNIEIVNDTTTSIEIAVAGFSREDLAVEVENNTLTVSGIKPSENQNDGSTTKEKRYQHRGIAFRNFKHRFSLMDHVVIRSCSLDNGILTIVLGKEVPERLKPKLIAIN